MKIERKQRAVYFSDSDWDAIKEAARLNGWRNVSHFVEDIMNQQSKKFLKKVDK